MKKILSLACILVALSLETSVFAAAFTAGNLVVYRVGSGSGVLTNTGNPVFLDEYNTSGTLIQSIPVNTNAFCAAGTSTSEGQMTLATNGQFVVFAGYATNGNVASLASSFGTAVPRTVGRVNANGNLDLSTMLSDYASGGSPRGAASTDGNNLWLSGGAGGVRYVTVGATNSTQLSTSVDNIHAVNIFSNQLYASSESGSYRLYTVGSGLPTTSGQICTNLPGLPTGTNSPNAFVFFKMVPGGSEPFDTLYFADVGGNVATNGLYKYSLIGGSWVQNGWLILDNAQGITGVLEISGSTTNVHLYMTSSSSSGVGYLVGYLDTAGFNNPPTGAGDTVPNNYDGSLGVNTPLYTSFRGVAFVPEVSGPANLSVSAASVFNSSGFKGGPFSPSSVVYTLSNTGVNTLNWTASTTPSWLSLSATSGALASGASVNVTASLNANANSLAVGSYSATIGFTNTTNGAGNTTRPVTLSVSQLGVSPAANFSTGGPVGGPFTPASEIYTLTNSDSSLSLSWGASVSANWVTLSASNGTLAANSGTAITVSINTNANSLTRGVYTATLAFTNAVSGDPGNATLSVVLTAGGGFTSGNLVIYRVGNGSVAPLNTGSPVFLDEYTTNGTLVQSVPVNTNLFCAAGTSTSEGLITRATNGLYLVFAGYATNGNVTSLASSASTAVPRTVGRIDGNGNLDLTTELSNYASGGSPRGVTSTDGNNLWLSGSVGGVCYATLGGTICTQLSSSVTNIRAVNIYSNQLYATSQSGSFRLYTVGPGLPTTSGQSCINLPGFTTSTGNPYSFVFFNRTGGAAPFDTLYVSDDGTVSGGIYKWSLVSGNWTSNGFVTMINALGVVANLAISGSTTNVNLYVTGGTSSAGTLTSLTDTNGWNTAPSGPINFTVNAPGNAGFRGIAFTPEGSAAAPPTASFSGSPANGAAPLTVTFTDQSSGSITGWAWAFGDGNTSTNQNPTDIYVNPGSYTVQEIVSGPGGASTDTVANLVSVYDPYAWWQQYYFVCTNCAPAQPNADPYGTGMSNTNKFLAGFNPTNPAAYLHIISIANTNTTDIDVIYLGANGDSTWSPGIASRTNVLEFTTGTANGSYSTNNFASTGQTNILSGGTGLGVVTNMVDSGGATNKPSRYYRVRVLLP
jgi:PKD repeat protein